MNQKQGVEALQEISLEELKQIKGIGRVKAIQIKAACELATRIAKPPYYRKTKIKNPADAAKILQAELQHEKREIIKLIVLNIKNEIKSIKDVAIGGINSVNTTIRDILCIPLKMQEPKIILAHNHPSGDSTPSSQDIKFTKQLYVASQLVEIELLDHLVIGNMQYTSIFEKYADKIVK